MVDGVARGGELDELSGARAGEGLGAVSLAGQRPDVACEGRGIHHGPAEVQPVDRCRRQAGPVVLHQQVAGEIRRAIAEGEAASGERLPSARDLAAVLQVNTSTVLRALRLLRDEGLLEFRRGRGVHVCGTPQRGVVLAKAQEFVRFGARQGYGPDELIHLISQLSAAPPGEGRRSDVNGC